jgi:hypothetical protein
MACPQKFIPLFAISYQASCEIEDAGISHLAKA